MLSKKHIDRVITAYAYKEPLRTLLHRFKYQHCLYLRSLLIDLMLQAPFDADATDCFVPVPLHRKRIQQRGFNQSAILAKQLATQHQLPYVANCCKKIIHSLPQAHLDSRQRRENLKNAFIAKPISYKRITLVDDLYTTGSTANEIAKAFKANGVLQVDILCCARAI